MTVKVYKSLMPHDFAAQVADYIEALNAHRHTVGIPRPTAPSDLVHSVVMRRIHPIAAKKPDDYFADYEVIDDTPKPKEEPVAPRAKPVKAVQPPKKKKAKIKLSPLKKKKRR